MAKYRPEGFENPYVIGRPVAGYGLAFEVGADAYADALREKPSSKKVRQYHEYYMDDAVNGTWVFIPDD